MHDSSDNDPPLKPSRPFPFVTSLDNVLCCILFTWDSNILCTMYLPRLALLCITVHITFMNVHDIHE